MRLTMAGCVGPSLRVTPFCNCAICSSLSGVEVFRTRTDAGHKINHVAVDVDRIATPFHESHTRSPGTVSIGPCSYSLLLSFVTHNVLYVTQQSIRESLNDKPARQSNAFGTGRGLLLLRPAFTTPLGLMLMFTAPLGLVLKGGTEEARLGNRYLTRNLLRVIAVGDGRILFVFNPEAEL